MCSIADRPHLQRGRFNYRHDTAGQRPYLQRGRVKLPTRHGRPASIPAARPIQATDTARPASVHTCSAAESSYRHGTAGQHPYLQHSRVKLPTRHGWPASIPAARPIQLPTRHGRPASIPAARPIQATDTARLASVHTCSAAESTTDTARLASVHTCSAAESSYQHGTASQGQGDARN